MSHSLTKDWSRRTSLLMVTALFGAFTLHVNLEEQRAMVQGHSPPHGKEAWGDTWEEDWDEWEEHKRRQDEEWDEHHPAGVWEGEWDESEEWEYEEDWIEEDWEEWEEDAEWEDDEDWMDDEDWEEWEHRMQEQKMHRRPPPPVRHHNAPPEHWNPWEHEPYEDEWYDEEWYDDDEQWEELIYPPHPSAPIDGEPHEVYPLPLEEEWEEEWIEEEEWEEEEWIDEEEWEEDEEHWCFDAAGNETDDPEACDHDQGRHFRRSMPPRYMPMHRPMEHRPMRMEKMGAAREHLQNSGVSPELQPIVDAVIHLLETLEVQMQQNGSHPAAEDVEVLINALRGMNQVMGSQPHHGPDGSYEEHREMRQEHFEERIANVTAELDEMFIMAEQFVSEATAREIELDIDVLNAYEGAVVTYSDHAQYCDSYSEEANKEDCKALMKEVFAHFRDMEKAVMHQVESDSELADLVDELFGEHEDF